MRKRRTMTLVLLTAILAWCGIFVTDYIRCSSLRRPIFAVPVVSCDDDCSGTYLGLGYLVDVKADPDDGIRSVEMRIFGTVVAASVS